MLIYSIFIYWALLRGQALYFYCFHSDASELLFSETFTQLHQETGANAPDKQKHDCVKSTFIFVTAVTYSSKLPAPTWL